MKVGGKQSNGRWWRHANNGSKYAQCTSGVFCVWSILVSLFEQYCNTQSDNGWTWSVNQGGVHRRQKAFILVHCLVLRTDVPGLQCTSQAVVGVTADHFCFIPIDHMHLVNCMLCYRWLGCISWRPLVHCAYILLLLACRHHLPLLCFPPTFISCHYFPPFMCI